MYHIIAPHLALIFHHYMTPIHLPIRNKQRKVLKCFIHLQQVTSKKKRKLNSQST